MKSFEPPYRWEVGKVNKSDAHIKIIYCSINNTEKNQFTPIVIVSAPKGRTFIVEFLINPEKPHETEMINSVKRELDFYLVDKKEDDPWAYAIYHCNSSANVYSNVHWSYYPHGHND